MTAVSPRGKVALACLLAILHGLFFIWYQRPDWNTQWSDQEGYARLGAVLAKTGKFTPDPDASRFVPEVIRTPAYPAFVAIVYRLLGTAHVFVAAAQTMLFALICLIVFAVARRVTSDSLAATAALVTALFPPIPYFGALVMTEVWTTLLFTGTTGLVIYGLAARKRSTFAWAGVLMALTALSRPAFAMFPVALVAVAAVLWPVFRVRAQVPLGHWMLMLAAFIVAMLPWFAYNYMAVGRLTLTPAGGAGRGVWEGSWQAKWPGRLQNDLTQLAERVDDPDALDRDVGILAARERLPAESMLRYVHQWQTLHWIWAAPTDPYERAMARVAADRAYFRVGLENIRRDGLGPQIRRLARGAFVLWAGEIPFRYSDINRLPAAVIRACWVVQALAFAVAMVGIYIVGRVHSAEAWVLAAPIVYVTAVHVPFLNEARQSLPAQPVLLILATVGTAHLWTRARGASATCHRTSGS
jgi:4-amino-4-deoxy-L-arabinose transferase-like glycosyltransferase